MLRTRPRKKFFVDCSITKLRNFQRLNDDMLTVAAKKVSKATALCSISSMACHFQSRAASGEAPLRCRSLLSTACAMIAVKCSSATVEARRSEEHTSELQSHVN